VQSVSLRRHCSPASVSELKELNRLARLVDLLPPSCSPILTQMPSILNSSDKSCTTTICSQLRLRKQDKFHHAFPKTKIPPVILFSGQPRVDKEFFNNLLSSKLSQLRSIYHLRSTPRGFAPLVSSWINRMLSVYHDSTLPSHVQKAKARKAKKTPVLRTQISFVPADPSTSTAAPSISNAVNNTDEKVQPVQSTDPSANESHSGLDLRDILTCSKRIRIRHAALGIAPYSEHPSAVSVLGPHFTVVTLHPDLVELDKCTENIPSLNIPRLPYQIDAIKTTFHPDLTSLASLATQMASSRDPRSTVAYLRTLSDYVSTF